MVYWFGNKTGKAARKLEVLPESILETCDYILSGNEVNDLPETDKDGKELTVLNNKLELSGNQFIPIGSKKLHCEPPAGYVNPG